jgi:hypothetical protein
MNSFWESGIAVNNKENPIADIVFSKLNASNYEVRDNKFNILVKHSMIVFIVKWKWKYFHKTTCEKKSLCIFALGFRITDIQKRKTYK